MDEQSVGKSLVHKINKLTVIASESYKDFVTDLQKQIKTDLYDRPRKATVDYFTGKTVVVNGNAEKLNKQQATMVYQKKKIFRGILENLRVTYERSNSRPLQILPQYIPTIK